MKKNVQVIAPEIKQAQKVAREVTSKMRRAHILAWAKQNYSRRKAGVFTLCLRPVVSEIVSTLKH